MMLKFAGFTGYAALATLITSLSPCAAAAVVAATSAAPATIAPATTAPTTTAPLQAAGLWEHTLDLASSGGELDMVQILAERQLAAMPPGQREQLRAMLAKRGVVLGSNGRSAKTCLTAAQAALPPQPQLAGGGCKATELSRSGKSMRYRFSCTQPVPVSGEGEVVFTDAKHYTGHATGTTDIVGVPQKMNIQVDGRWLGADCSALKATPPP